MKPDSPKWGYVLDGALVPGVSLAVAAIVLGVCAWYQGVQSARFEVYSANHAAIHEDYDALIYRRALMERYHSRYSEFQDMGFVGRESRLDWIETIRMAAKTLELPSVSYSLEPQREVIRPVHSASPDADIQIHLSQLELELGLVHELDLLRFFSALKQKAPGLMKTDRCELARQTAFDQELVAGPNIVARCSLGIFSVITSDIPPEAAAL